MDNRKYDMTKDSISIGQFVSQYLEINVDCTNLKHKGLKSFDSPFVIGVSNSYADKNPELVKKGFLLLVLDCKKNKGTYINPIALRSLLDKELVEDELRELQKIRTHNFEEMNDFFQKYMEVAQMQEQLERFYGIMKELRKESSLEKIKRQQKLFKGLNKK